MGMSTGGRIGLAATLLGAGMFAVLGVANALESNVEPRTIEPTADGRVLVAQAGTKVAYTADQAAAGKKVYEEDCVECHGKDMRGGLLGGPPLRGLAFDGKYGGGLPAGTLYEVMVATMPPNDPGRYSPQTYADLMAYILKTNGYKAGAELTPDVDALYELVIEK